MPCDIDVDLASPIPSVAGVAEVYDPPWDEYEDRVEVLVDEIDKGLHDEALAKINKGTTDATEED